MLWREKHLLEILEAGKISTTEVVERASMSKATALKYLEGLKGLGLVTCEMIGPTKLWSLTKKEELNVETKEQEHGEEKRFDECIYVDRRIFKLFDEFERVTGNRVEISITQTGMKVNVQDAKNEKDNELRREWVG